MEPLCHDMSDWQLAEQVRDRAKGQLVNVAKELRGVLPESISADS